MLSTVFFLLAPITTRILSDYPPFEVKYIKRKAEHGVNAQYIMTSNHMGTHLDAPRHFVTNGRTIDEIPVEWLCGVYVRAKMIGEPRILTEEELAKVVERGLNPPEFPPA